MISDARSNDRKAAREGAGAGVPGTPRSPTGALEHRVADEALALLLAGVGLASLWLLIRPLGLVLAGAVIASALSPLVHSLERRLPRLAAILLIYAVVLLVACALMAVTVPALVVQAQALFVGGPNVIGSAQHWMVLHGPLPFDIDQIAQVLSASIDRISMLLISLPLTILSTTTEVLVVAVVSMYWLMAAPSLRRFALSLLPLSGRTRADALFQEICQTMGGYVRATVVDMLLLGTLVYIGLSLIGVKYAVVLALLAGLGALVPIVGPIITAVPALAVAFIDSPLRALIVLVFYVVLHNVESDFLLPNLIKSQTDIPPLLVLFALLVAGASGSVLAALIAIPVAGALRVLVVRVVAPAIRRRSGATKEQSGEGS